MTYYLDYYVDTIPAGVKATIPAAMRMIYVYGGSVKFGDRQVDAAPMKGNDYEADKACAFYGAGETAITAGPGGATLFRYDLAEGSKADKFAAGDGVSSDMKMSREIWSLDIQKGSDWLFRLDYIRNPQGQTADVHTHEGPGIRTLLTGTFHCNQPSEEGRADQPGDPWWETGIEAVISTPSGDCPAKFLRAMVLPSELSVGPRMSGKFLRNKIPSEPGWKVWDCLVDKLVTL